MEIHGVGPKVADCISLFSLDKHCAIPVDTHVWSLAQKYLPELREKNVTKNTYEVVQRFFETELGEHCGWAHTYLFVGELAAFKIWKDATGDEKTNAKHGLKSEEATRGKRRRAS